MFFVIDGFVPAWTVIDVLELHPASPLDTAKLMTTTKRRYISPDDIGR
jgi:hypothetical protein